jgi:hypothetical protein
VLVNIYSINTYYSCPQLREKTYGIKIKYLSSGNEMKDLNFMKHLKCYVSSPERMKKYIKITNTYCKDVPKVIISGDDSVKNYTNRQI